MVVMRFESSTDGPSGTRYQRRKRSESRDPAPRSSRSTRRVPAPGGRRAGTPLSAQASSSAGWHRHEPGATVPQVRDSELTRQDLRPGLTRIPWISANILFIRANSRNSCLPRNLTCLLRVLQFKDARSLERDLAGRFGLGPVRGVRGSGAGRWSPSGRSLGHGESRGPQRGLRRWTRIRWRAA